MIVGPIAFALGFQSLLSSIQSFSSYGTSYYKEVCVLNFLTHIVRSPNLERRE